MKGRVSCRESYNCLNSTNLTVHALAQAAAPVAADALHGVPVLPGQSRVSAHQVKAGDDGLVHDGGALRHVGLLAAAKQPRCAFIQSLGRRREVKVKRIENLIEM